MKTIKREIYLERIRPFYDSNYIKVITGIRRSGKSELLKQIIDEIKQNGIDNEHIIILNLEGKIGSTITTRYKLEKYLDTKIKDDKKYYIFIDEIQHIYKFEIAITSIRVSYNCSLFITGSNSNLLHGKLQDRLTGRAKEFEIYPFTYKEVLEFKKLNNLPIRDDEFEQFLKFGGMPQIFEEVDENGINEYLISLYKSIIEKDVFKKHAKINKSSFENVAQYIISSTGRKFSALSIAKYLEQDLSSDEKKSFSKTINAYASYLEDCYFLSECLPYFLKGKQRLRGTKKYYAIDVGLRNAFGNNIEFNDTFSLENVIYNELLVRGYKVKYGHLKDGEIDFVAIKGEKKCLIQISYSINDENTFNREYGAFNKIKDASPKYVITLDKKDTSNNGITHLNCIDFLLGKVDIYLT